MSRLIRVAAVMGFVLSCVLSLAGTETQPVAVVVSCSGDARVKTLRDGTVFARAGAAIQKGETVVAGKDGHVLLSLASGKTAQVNPNSSWPKSDFFEPVKKGWDIFIKTLARQLQLNKNFKPGGGKGGVLPEGGWAGVASEAVLGDPKQLDVLVLIRGAAPRSPKVGPGAFVAGYHEVARSRDKSYVLVHYRLKSSLSEVSLSADKKPPLTWKVRDNRLPNLIEADAFLSNLGEGQVVGYLGAGRPVSAVISASILIPHADKSTRGDLAKTLNRIASKNGDFDIPELTPPGAQ